MNNKILVVDDEDKIRKMISDYLSAVGFETVTARDGIEAITVFIDEQPDLIIMDIMMPGLDGIDATRRIRERSTVPVILVTAKAEEGDKLMGLEMGADDYVVKPFSLKELGARVRAQLRRVSFSEPKEEKIETKEVVEIDGLKVDFKKMSVSVNGKRVNLTSVQFTILKLLINNPGRVYNREEILGSFQEDIFEGYERTIDVHIKNIRKIIEEIPSKPKYIETVWGTGYRFKEQEE